MKCSPRSEQLLAEIVEAFVREASAARSFRTSPEQMPLASDERIHLERVN